ncbi:DUF397 domain-containing protein [Streptomyces sp. ISL-10]|uniref:DUF397 domain-containing protein n=1 Tax=Streptomyces sp. ISL-10 TaxID=2819172 RepID=UPI001BE9AE43|nr:DUF397 domain-containing protein [Streptomyces sp. ISL-10]MBT2364373.1 DUF397 domain-containing protein [Streptomyces sp. ISL-10]
MSTEQAAHGPDRLNWFKSSYSGSGGGDCVEVAASAGDVHVRDSENTTRPGLRVSRASWAAFVAEATR